MVVEINITSHKQSIVKENIKHGLQSSHKQLATIMFQVPQPGYQWFKNIVTDLHSKILMILDESFTELLYGWCKLE